MVNRKGQIAIGLLVLMTLVLTGAALYSFYNNSQSLKLQISDARFVDKVYSDELLWKITAMKQVESLTVEGYSKASIDNRNSEETEKEIENSIGKVLIVNDKNKSETKEASVELNDEQVKITMEDFPISARLLLKSKERVWVWGFIPASSFEQIKASIGVIYRPSMITTLNLTKIGLHGFRQINSALESCKMFDTKQEIENCLQKRLVNFDITANIVNDENWAVIDKSVEMKSKRVFAINGQLKKVEFKTALT